MAIKNYTSTVPVEKSVNLIEHRLVAAGATNISKTFGGEPKRLQGIVFQIPVNGYPQLFKLPCRDEAVYTVLMSEVRRPRQETAEKIRKQSQRTAWKLLSDWVDIQVALIKLQQIELIEVFLPYCYNPETDQTLFQKLKESNYKLLK